MDIMDFLKLSHKAKALFYQSQAKDKIKKRIELTSKSILSHYFVSYNYEGQNNATHKK